MPATNVSGLRAALLEHAPLSAATDPHLRNALAYALAGTGGLSRARLVLAGASAHGLDPDAGLRLACAVEYYHLASLLLDDLPCMDNADTRRGRPALHTVCGESTTLLAALAFINRAYGLLGLVFAEQPWLVRTQVHLVVDACLGAAGILGGQSRDLRFSDGPQTTAAAARVALGKTASLFSLALFLPALAGQPSAAERRALKALCVYWGLAYQACDDLRDVLASPAALGKPTQRDRQLARPNLALLGGVAFARLRIARLTTQAERALRRLDAAGPRWSYLHTLHQALFDQTAAGSAAA